jgi:hypothetical protein
MPSNAGPPHPPRRAWLALALAVTAAIFGASPTAALGAAATPVVDTAIVEGPAEGAVVEAESAVFAFTATLDGAPLGGAAFKCSLDDGPAEPCASPLNLEELEVGPHTFAVFAEDPRTAIADPEPARRSFEVALPAECESAQEESEGEEESEAEAEEAEEDEAGCGELAPPADAPPAQCPLRSIRARLLTYTEADRLLLVIRYTSLAATDVRVELAIAGHGRPSSLGSAERHLGRRGVIRLAERLGEARMARVRSAKGFTVTLEVPAAPDLCRRSETRHLTIRRAIHGDAVWVQSDPRLAR